MMTICKKKQPSPILTLTCLGEALEGVQPGATSVLRALTERTDLPDLNLSVI